MQLLSCTNLFAIIFVEVNVRESVCGSRLSYIDTCRIGIYGELELECPDVQLLMFDD